MTDEDKEHLDKLVTVTWAAVEILREYNDPVADRLIFEVGYTMGTVTKLDNALDMAMNVITQLKNPPHPK